jgi:hypothetical protein
MRLRTGTPVRALNHPAETRPNIPTAELESFARPEEKRPAIVRYPRDPTIDPLALVEELRAESEGRRSEQPLGFFST